MCNFSRDRIKGIYNLLRDCSYELEITYVDDFSEKCLDNFELTQDCLKKTIDYLEDVLSSGEK